MFEEALSSHDQSCRRQEALQEPEPQLSWLANQFSQPNPETTVGAASINPEPRPHDCQSSSPLAQSFDKEHERITDTEGGSNCQDQDSRIWRHHDARKDAAVMQIFGDAAARVVAGRSRSLPHSGKGTPRRLPGRNDRSTAIKQNIKLMQDLNQVLFQQHTKTLVLLLARSLDHCACGIKPHTAVFSFYVCSTFVLRFVERRTFYVCSTCRRT